MVAPLVIGGMMAASAAANYMGNENARSASNKALRAAAKQRDQSTSYLDQIDPAQLEALNQAYLQSLGNEGAGLNYTPETYQYLASPEYMQNTYLGDAQSTLIADSPEMRNAQLAALGNLQQRAETGLDANSKAQFLRAQQAAGEFSRGREGAIMNDMQGRGMGGSGLEMAMRQMAGQQGGDSLSQSMADQAAADASQRMQAELLALESAGNIRGQDVGTQETNADILNQFSMKNSAARQQISNMNTDLGNERIKGNIAEQRKVSAGNTDLRNNGQLTNLGFQQLRNKSANDNLMTQYGGATDVYDAGVAKKQSLANAALGGITESYAKGAANADYARGTAGAVASVPSAMAQYYIHKDTSDEDKDTDDEGYSKY